tara:strand:- start:1752 stop:2240 length:489 start_codon:yes stop_codon:yes gene_type:complete
MANSFITTFDFNKLQSKLKTIFKDELNVLGNGINKAIQDGIDAGKDIEGNNFEPLHDITKMTGGSKILERTGNMKKTNKDPAKENDLKFVITGVGVGRKGKHYGAFHNQEGGYTNPPGSWFPGTTVNQRKWFGISKEMRIGGSEFDKRILEIRARIESAFRK